jgi:hypothetical protein
VTIAPAAPVETASYNSQTAPGRVAIILASKDSSRLRSERRRCSDAFRHRLARSIEADGLRSIGTD